MLGREIAEPGEKKQCRGNKKKILRTQEKRETRDKRMNGQGNQETRKSPSRSARFVSGGARRGFPRIEIDSEQKLVVAERRGFTEAIFRVEAHRRRVGSVDLHDSLLVAELFQESQELREELAANGLDRVKSLRVAMRCR